MGSEILCCRDLAPGSLAAVLAEWDLRVVEVADGEPIPGSYWGAPEAGIRGSEVFVRGDTPVHSALHEACHLICARAEGRWPLDTDAGGDYAEEDAVCYLQILLADRLPEVGSERLMEDMDTWGYTFRLGSAQAWFEQDAQDARRWLETRERLPAVPVGA